MEKRPKHYVSHGSRCYFNCYREELRQLIESNWTVPEPLRTTDIKQVTCPRCIQQIKILMDRMT